MMQDGPLRSSDYLLRCFLKAEKCKLDGLSKPRMIFPRSPRYNLHLASWLKPFEHWLWGNLKSVGSSGVARCRVCAKGLNPEERANLILRKMRSIPDCVVFEVDGKAFEAHVDVWQLLQEHNVYTTAYPGDRDLKLALNKQLRNTGVTSCGVKFSRPGGRASGDYNTGMGNSICMLAVVDGAMSVLGCRTYDSLVDGDNALIFIPRSSIGRVVPNFAPVVERISGHEMVLTREVDYPEGVRFGQSAPVQLEPGVWRMVRDWRKVISHGSSSHAHLQEPSFVAEWLLGVARCEAWLARGVPILSTWAESIRARTETGKPVRWDPHRDYSCLGVPEGGQTGAPGPVSDLARASFCRAFGVEPDEQLLYEGLLGRDWKLVTSGTARPATSREPWEVWGWDW